VSLLKLSVHCSEINQNLKVPSKQSYYITYDSYLQLVTILLLDNELHVICISVIAYEALVLLLTTISD